MVSDPLCSMIRLRDVRFLDLRISKIRGSATNHIDKRSVGASVLRVSEMGPRSEGKGTQETLTVTSIVMNTVDPIHTHTSTRCLFIRDF